MVKYLHGSKLIESDFGLYLYDAHGNVTEILDSDYDIAQSYTYDPFGDSIISTAESEIRDPDMEMQSLIPGDKVLAANPETGEQDIKTVVQTFVNETDELVHVTVNGETITTTPEHPFYVPQKGWTGAIHLRAGDILVSSNGEYVVVEKVEHELLESPVKVYNFEVEDFHTYYVSEFGVLVHNMCDRREAVRQAWKEEYETVKATGQGKTRIWSSDELDELLSTGRVKGYEGHHMYSVSAYPELAGDPNNIQFLTRQEHFAAHGFNWRNITNGWFNP